GERGAGSGGTGSTHDAQCVVYEGPDQEYKGREICVGFNETEIAVVDVTNKEHPTLISTATYPNFGYVHQGWFTGDQRYMYSNDEVDELAGKVDQTRTIVWDMKDLDNPVVANQFSLSNPSSDHNLYVKGDRIYESNYKSGLRVLDISNPEKPEEVGHFDLFPPSDTPGFEGAWSNYPYFESGIVVTATFGGGFFVLEYSQPEIQ
ncbi:MAG: choice-of-anchor B family protein, partial [Salinibacter sp.]